MRFKVYDVANDVATRQRKKLLKREGDGWVRRNRHWDAEFDVMSNEPITSNRNNANNMNSYQHTSDNNCINSHNQLSHHGRHDFDATTERRVVLKRSERDALPGWECDQCRRFYEALASDGFHVPSGTEMCRHSLMSVDTILRYPKATTSGTDVVQQTSRHRLHTKVRLPSIIC
eukprot:GHVU01117585.1.p1 GENE.GHVU01117585.1~~GHVU01117585.1.p1  ORF type:complete len:174 (-),score=12.24 GHVU01117585.1:191-712(-)